VNPPTTAAVLNDWGDPSLLARFQQAAQEIAADHGVPLLDLYEKGPTLVPDDGWWDPQHLNKGGAAIVSRVVADQVLVDLFQNRQNGAPAGGQ
jgi:lysophospholipase L1-like esterase